MKAFIIVLFVALLALTQAIDTGLPSAPHESIRVKRYWGGGWWNGGWGGGWRPGWGGGWGGGWRPGWGGGWGGGWSPYGR